LKKRTKKLLFIGTRPGGKRVKMDNTNHRPITPRHCERSEAIQLFLSTAASVIDRTG
jgi:hypothetical protein